MSTTTRDLAEAIADTVQAELYASNIAKYHRLTRQEIYAVALANAKKVEKELNAIAASRTNILPMPLPEYANLKVTMEAWNKAHRTARTAKRATTKKAG